MGSSTDWVSREESKRKPADKSKRLDEIASINHGYWAGNRFAEPHKRADSGAGAGLEAAARHIYDEALALLLAKHANYGPKNIVAAPGGALNGLRVRMHDKLARINHMIDSGTPDQVGESMQETFIDLLNYSAIALLVLRRQWPDA